jgi:hypothetical protein
LNPCLSFTSYNDNGLAWHANHSATENNGKLSLTTASGAVCLDFETDIHFQGQNTTSFSTRQDEKNELSDNEIGDTLKIENLTLTMNIPFEEILPSDIRLCAGTRNNPNLSILGAF